MARGEVRFKIVADSKPFQDAFTSASKELDKFASGVADSAGALGKVAAAAGPVGIALSVAAGAGVVAFGALAAAVSGAVKGLVETGGHLADLSAKTGISTEALQKLAYAGSLVGVSQEEITGAAVKMEKALANGDAVFGKLGLSVQKLRAMKPDEAFAAIAAQIAKIKDPAGQAAAAMEAFGKSGASMLPLIKSDLAGATAEAERLGIVLSDQTVAAADALGDEATKLGAAWEGVKNQFAAAIIQNPALLNALHGLVTMMGELSQWMIKNRGAIGAVVDILIGTGRSAVEGFKQLASWAGTAGSKLKYIVDLVPGLRSMLNVMRDVGTYLDMKNGEGSGLTSSASVGGGGLGLTFNGKAGTAALKAQREEEARIEKIAADTMAKIRTDAVKTVNAQLEAEYKRGVKIVGFQLDEWVKEEKLAAEAIKKVRDQLNEVGRKNADIWKEMYARAGDQVAGIFDQVAHHIGGVWGELFHDLGNLMAKWVSDNKAGMGDWVADHKEKIAAVVAGIQTIYSAYQGGVASKSPGKGALAGAGKGAATGAAIGAVFGGVGAAPGAIIGGVVGGIAGFIGGKKGQAAELRVLSDEFQRLRAQAQAAGVVLNHTFDPKNPQQYRAAIDEIGKALDTQAQAQQALSDALGRYNFTLAETGPILAAQELDKQFAQIYQDYELLTRAGVDHNAVLREMGPNVGKYVDAAAAAGVEIPAAMKPIIDDLYQHGQLLHENGEAYTEAEYNGIAYAQTMSQMFRELIDIVKNLVAALGFKVEDKHFDVVEHRRVVNNGGGGGGDEEGRETPRERRERIEGFASGGIFPARPGGHVIRVAEGGQPEAVLNPQQMASLAGGSPEVLSELRSLNDNIRAALRSQPKAIRDALLLMGAR